MTAAKDGSTEVAQAKARATEGQDFSGLLARLNAGSASPSPGPSNAPVQKKKKRSREEDESTEKEAPATIEAAPALMQPGHRNA